MVRRIEKNLLLGDTEYKVYISCNTKTQKCMVHIGTVDHTGDWRRMIATAYKAPKHWTVNTTKLLSVKMSYLEMKQELVKALIYA